MNILEITLSSVSLLIDMCQLVEPVPVDMQSPEHFTIVLVNPSGWINKLEVWDDTISPIKT